MGWICRYGAQGQTSAQECEDSQINRVIDLKSTASFLSQWPFRSIPKAYTLITEVSLVRLD